MWFFMGLAGPEMLMSVLAIKTLANPPIACTVPKTGKMGGNYYFFHLLWGFLYDAHDMLTKFLNLKPSFILGSDTKYVYGFI